MEYDVLVDIEESDKARRERFMDMTDDACMVVSKARSPVLNTVSALMGDPDLPIENKAKLYLELNELASVVTKAKKMIREHLEVGGNTDYDVGHQICEVRIVHSDTLDTATWKKNDPRGYAITKMDYLRATKKLSVKFRNKKGK